MTLNNDIKDAIERFVRGKRSGVLLVKRSAFGDPFLTAYFYKGTLLHATSFAVKRMWWEGILSDKEVSLVSGEENLFRYAAKKYGKKYLEHIVSHAKVVIREALEFASINGWDVFSEVHHMREDEIERMFGLDVIRNIKSKAGEKVPGAEGTSFHSIVLSLISGNRGSTSSEEEVERKKTKGEAPNIVLRARALGFFILYVPGEDNSVFFSTLGEFSGTFGSKFQSIMEDLSMIRGTVALLFPLFALVRFGSGEEEIWGITSDARKIAYALRYMDEATDISESVLNSLSEKYGTSFVWREGNDLVVFGRCERKRVSIKEFVEIYSEYFDRFRKLVDEAVSKMPGNMPMKLKKIHVLNMLSMCPIPDAFKREFYARFGIKLES